MNDPLDPTELPWVGAHVERGARRFGWTSLLAWAALGTVLEAAHGFKVATYLDDELTRLLLRLGHAHGVGLSLVILAWSVASPPKARTPGTLRSLAAGALLIPLGFALGALGHPEGDPGPAIFLVPVGAAALLFGLARTAFEVWRAPSL